MTELTTEKKQLKLIEKFEDGSFNFENVKTGEIESYKISSQKSFKDKIEIGELGNAEVYGVWLNVWKPYEVEDKPRPLPKKKEYDPNGAREGMFINNAVHIAIAEMNANNYDVETNSYVNIDRVEEIYNELKKRFEQ